MLKYVIIKITQNNDLKKSKKKKIFFLNNFFLEMNKLIRISINNLYYYLFIYIFIMQQNNF